MRADRLVVLGAVELHRVLEELVERVGEVLGADVLQRVDVVAALPLDDVHVELGDQLLDARHVLGERGDQE